MSKRHVEILALVLNIQILVLKNVSLIPVKPKITN